MPAPEDRFEEIQETLNPHRRDELERANAHAIDTLRGRGVKLDGRETSEELADMQSAVEHFERAVEARGGDTFTNSPASSDPDNPAFVVPERLVDEPAREYIARIWQVAEQLFHIER